MIHPSLCPGDSIRSIQPEFCSAIWRSHYPRLPGSPDTDRWRKGNRIPYPLSGWKFHH